MVIRDPSLKHWLVMAEAPDATGQRWLRIRGQWRYDRSIKRPADNTPCIIMEASETEAILLLQDVMAASIISHENNKTLPMRAMKFRMDPIDISGRGGKERIHWHVDEFHSVYLEPSMSAKKAAEAHAEMHATETMEMSTPHHHERIT